MIVTDLAGTNIARITLDRPAQRNAFDWSMLEAFGQTLDDVEGDKTIRIAVIRSAIDRVFVAGGDIAVMRDLTLTDGAAFVYAGQHLLRRLEESRIVFIAAVGGYALGGGLELALACDLIVASESATFGLPETTIGLLPGWGGTQRLVRCISPQRAKELVYTGRRIAADEGLSLGFVNRVVPDADIDEESLSLAREIIRSSPTAVSQAKRALTQGARVSLDQGLVIEAEAWLANLSSPNRAEGLSAFLEKRKPHFTVD